MRSKDVLVKLIKIISNFNFSTKTNPQPWLLNRNGGVIMIVLMFQIIRRISMVGDMVLQGLLFVVFLFATNIGHTQVLGVFVAGDGTVGYSGDGGPAISGQLNGPYAVTMDSAGNLYIADAHNQRIRKVDLNGIISTVAGTGTSGFSGDGGPATAAQLNTPHGVATDNAGNLYIADTYNRRIRKIDASGTISTVVGDGTEGSGGDGGPAVSAQLSTPTGVAVDTTGNLHIADSTYKTVRLVDSSGIITSLNGDSTKGEGGPGTVSLLNTPFGMAVDSVGNLYVADFSNNQVRKVAFEGAKAAAVPTLGAWGLGLLIVLLGVVAVRRGRTATQAR